MQCSKTLINYRKLSKIKPFLTNFRNVRNKSTINYNYSNCTTFKIPMVTFLFNQYSTTVNNSLRKFCTILNTEIPLIDSNTFEKVCEETLDSLSEYLEELVENSSHLQSADVAYSSGVLTVSFGSPYGTYVINRQSPNRQIWLSSPTSGPKRYDYDLNRQMWFYKHDGMSLHKLLQEEIPKIVKNKVDFSKCLHSQI